MNTILLLSGGLDSVSLAYWARPKYALTVDYGQRAANAECVAAARVAHDLGIKHFFLQVDFGEFGLGRTAGQQSRPTAPSPEWWPFRNQLLITLAAAKAIVVQADSVMVGTLRTDNIHLDGSPGFIASMAALLAQQEGAIRLLAPALQMDGLQLAKRSGAPKDILGWTHSCHVGNLACGRCRGCVKHEQTMRQLLSDTP